MCRIPRVRLFNLQTKKRTVEQKASKGLMDKIKLKNKKSSNRAAFLDSERIRFHFFFYTADSLTTL